MPKQCIKWNIKNHKMTEISITANKLDTECNSCAPIC